MDSFSVYPLSQLLSPQLREEGIKGSEIQLEIKGRSPPLKSKHYKQALHFNSYMRKMENNVLARETGEGGLWLLDYFSRGGGSQI